MKLTLTTLFSLLILVSFAQSSNFIEIAVDETVELQPKTVTIQITVESEDDQRDDYRRKEFGYDEYSYEYDDYEEYYYDEEDWMYEEMLEESPKKITKEMKKEYEERARKREEQQKLREEREEEIEIKMASFRTVSSSDVQAKISELNLASKIVKRTSTSIYDALEYFEDEYDSYYPDSIIEVTISNSEEWEKLQTALNELPTDEEVTDMTHQTMDDQYATVIPKLTQKATSQAQIIATSMNRKLGKVLECTNVYPFTPSKLLMGTYTRQLERMLETQSYGSNPFESTKKEVIEYVYKFQLL